MRTSFWQLGLHEPGHGDAGPAAHHLGHVLGVDLLLQHGPVGLQLGQRLGGVLDAALELGHQPVADLRGPGEVAVAGEALRLALPRLELPLEGADAR